MMTPTQDATSFDAWAGEYDRFRPGYPDVLFDGIAERLGLTARPVVADLGAGTGMATFAMARRGWRITAIEPAPRMLAVLRRRANAMDVRVDTVEASAEATGLPDSSVDLAVAAQAFHWFDRPSAVAEMVRIVRPGGGVALFWNVRDAERSAFVAAYERLISRLFGAAGIGQYQADGREAEHAATRAAFAAVPGFETPRYVEPEHEIDMTAETFLGMAFTASYVRRLGNREQDRFRDEVSRLLAAHGHDRGTFAIPYRIHLWTARRTQP